MSPFSRRDLLRGAGAALTSAACGAGAQGAKQRPNIILVLLDDLGYGQFGPNSDMFDLSSSTRWSRTATKEIRPRPRWTRRRAPSTNLTRLATEGTRFTDAYVACPLCAPSRSAIMTSRYPQRFGGYINQDIESGGVPPDQLFPAQLLQKSGYRTAAIGKWHVAKMQGGMDSGAGQHPLERGFDYFFGFNSCCSTYYDATNLLRNREKASPEGFITDQFTDEAIRLHRAAAAGQAILPLPALQRRARPATASPRRTNICRAFNTGRSAWTTSTPICKPPMKASGGSAACWPRRGRRTTRSSSCSATTAHPANTPIPSNAPFLGFKGQVWQGGVRVPMVVWGAGFCRRERSAGSPSSRWT